MRPMEVGGNTETAILAGGCFWGVQELLGHRDGVLSTRVGWSGCDIPNPTEASPGTHAEAVEVVFDPEQVSFRDILEFFFQIHDPTTKDRQGDETGAHVRSAIFYMSDEQRQVAEETAADVAASGLWPGKVVTEIEPAGQFWEAEPEDQDYLQKHPDGETCHFPRPNWKLPHPQAAG
jgi:peptide-methionine (S)-S-oxide reductase